VSRAFHTPTARPLGRRAFLRGAGVALSLPLLDAMTPAFGKKTFAQGSNSPRGEASGPPRRMLAIQTNMGILPQFFFPEGAGRDYRPSPYLEILKDHRDELTVFSGVSHPNVDGGHQAEPAFLTAAPHPGRAGFKNSISLDQFAAEQIGARTRFPSFTLLVGNGPRTLSFTRSGVQVPGETSPAALYRRMFVQGDAREVATRIEDLRVGRSILDFVHDGARRLQKDLGPRDRERLDQYFTAVRDLEGELHSTAAWEHRPKPKAPAPAPQDVTDRNQLVARTKLMFDMARLALETDSTRLVTVFINTVGVVADLPGVSRETHSLSHHGNVPETLAELRIIEEAQFKVLADLLGSLRETPEEGQTLLDRTMVLYGSCLGSANAHSNVNLPVLLAGGGFHHGRHLAFDRRQNYPLPNLFVSMLQRLGIEADRFASSTGTMRGLESVG
jgi:hypothetical protein